MSEYETVRPHGNDHSTEADEVGSGNASSAVAMKDEGFNNVGFRLTHDNTDRVARGGSWFLTAGRARAAGRVGGFPGGRSGNLGVRLVFDREKP